MAQAEEKGTAGTQAVVFNHGERGKANRWAVAAL
jgi:hypothetical protein